MGRILLSILKICADGKEHLVREAVDEAIKTMDLVSSLLAEKIPSGKQSVYYNRGSWARTYLKQSGLLESPKNGVIKISALRKAFLDRNPKSMSQEDLYSYLGYQEFIGRSKSEIGKSAPRQIQIMLLSGKII